jgi:predicted nuclease of predicted toxin-antitoxin system
MQIEATHVGELNMASASDQRIIDYARENSFSIVTLDADFHALLAVARAAGPSVIGIRVQPLKAPQAVSLILLILERLGNEIRQGCLVSVTSTSIRMRRLPIDRR